MRSGKINFIGILIVLVGTVGGVWLWRFGPYHYDHWEMNEVVKSAARTWKDLGESHARGRLLDEMKTRDLPTYLTEEMCSFTELGSRKTVTCEWIGIYLFVEPGSTAGNYRYQLAMRRAGNITCPNMENQLPTLGESLELDGGPQKDCQTPPRVMPAEIESWVQSPKGSKTLNMTASVSCSDGSSSTTESATVALTLVPCNGAPCLYW